MPIFDQIVRQGRYFVIDEYTFKKDLVELMTGLFLEAIEAVCGTATRDQVDQAGFRLLHRFIQPDQIIDLQDEAAQRLKTPMLRYSGRFAQDVLGMGDDFYVDVMTIARIKAPFEFAKQSTMSYLDYSKKKGRTSFKRDPGLTSGYHRNLPFPAWNHGPHSDSYFGHSYDGINLWWSVDGVTEENGMVFYPQIICDPGIPVLQEPPYLGCGVGMPKPVFFTLEPGDVIAFNSDTLHATRLNLSEVTRVSYSTRLNPWKPRFDQKNFRHVKLWIHSSELKKLDQPGKYRLPDNETCHRLADSGENTSHAGEDIRILVMPKEDHGNLEGQKGSTLQTHYQCERRVLDSGLELKQGAPVVIGDAAEIADGEKVLVRFSNNIQVVVARTGGQLTALGAKCPHVGYDIIDGIQDGNQLICAGHGIAYDLHTGKSKSDLFRLAVFPVWEENGKILLALDQKASTT